MRLSIAKLLLLMCGFLSIADRALTVPINRELAQGQVIMTILQENPGMDLISGPLALAGDDSKSARIFVHGESKQAVSSESGNLRDRTDWLFDTTVQKRCSEVLPGCLKLVRRVVIKNVRRGIPI